MCFKHTVCLKLFATYFTLIGPCFTMNFTMIFKCLLWTQSLEANWTLVTLSTSVLMLMCISHCQVHKNLSTNGAWMAVSSVVTWSLKIASFMLNSAVWCHVSSWSKICFCYWKTNFFMQLHHCSLVTNFCVCVRYHAQLPWFFWNWWLLVTWKHTYQCVQVTVSWAISLNKFTYVMCSRPPGRPRNKWLVLHGVPWLYATQVAEYCCPVWPVNYYFTSAAVAVDSCHMTASSSTSWSRFSPSTNFVNGHVSTMWFMVCCWPQSQEDDWARPNLCTLARHGLWPVLKWFIKDHVWRGRSKPCCRKVGNNSVVDHRSRRPVLSPLRSGVDRCHAILGVKMQAVEVDALRNQHTQANLDGHQWFEAYCQLLLYDVEKEWGLDVAIQISSTRNFIVQCAWFQAACDPQSSHGCQCSAMLHYLLYHEPQCQHVPINKIWRWTESTPRRGQWCSHMAGIYNWWP